MAFRSPPSVFVIMLSEDIGHHEFYVGVHLDQSVSGYDLVLDEMFDGVLRQFKVSLREASGRSE